MSKGTRYTPSQKTEMIVKARKLKARGMSQEVIARKFGIHPNTLSLWLTTQSAPAVQSTPKETPAEAPQEVKASLPTARRYSPEQKRMMKDKALAMIAHGKSKLAVQEELGIAYKTLVALLADSSVSKSAKSAKSAKATKQAAKKTVKIAADPVQQMADIRNRILEINADIAQLNKTRESLQQEMEVVYKRIGEEILG